MPKSNFGYVIGMNLLPYLVNKEKGLGLSVLKVEQNLKAIREKCKKGKYFEKLI